jgi:hypothetical protein
MFLRVLKYEFLVFLMLIKYQKCSSCENYKFFGNSIIYIYIYIYIYISSSCRTCSRFRVRFFARSLNRFSSRTTCRSHLLSPCTPFVYPVYPLVSPRHTTFLTLCVQSPIPRHSFFLLSSQASMPASSSQTVALGPSIIILIFYRTNSYVVMNFSALG